MAASGFRVPTAEEEKILARNGIDPKSVAVTYRGEGVIHMVYHKTRDEITLRQGDKKWCY